MRQQQQSHKLSPRQITETNLLGYGLEPEFNSDPLTLGELCSVYAWYGALKDRKDAIQYLKDYVADNPKAVQAVERTDVSTTYGWMARILKRGAILPDSDVVKLDRYIADLVKYSMFQPTKTVDREKAKADKIDRYLPVFEQAVDTLDASFDAYKFLSDNAVPLIYVSRIHAYYKPIAAEVQLALSRNDPQVIAAYSHLGTVDLKKTLAYYQAIMNACVTFIGNVKKVKKPRKVKQKSADQILKHFRCCVKHEPLQLVSIDPLQIIGAQQLFVYNIANNILTMFNASDESGLGISRSSVTGFSEDLTKSKRVGKKLKEALDRVSTGSKKQRAAIMELFSTEFVRTSDRINTNVVLLKAYKK